MDLIIQTKNIKYYLTLNNSKKEIGGYCIVNGEIKPLDNNVFSMLSIFMPTTNTKYICKSDGYELYQDMITGLIYYYKNGNIDFKKFFEENAVDACMGINISKRAVKAMIIASATVIFAEVSAIAFLLNSIANKDIYSIANEDISMEQKIAISKMLETRDLEVNDIRNAMYSSEYLSQEETDFLYNENYLNTIVPYYNKKHQNEAIMLYNYTNMEIQSYGEEVEDDSLGYYSPLNNNTIYVRYYGENTNKEAEKDTLSHEYVHLTQYYNLGYKMIYEAMAEIMSEEFYNANVVSYKDYRRFTKILIETIGTKPIMELVYTGDTKQFKNILNTYLEPEEVTNMLRIMSGITTVDRKQTSKISVEDKQSMIDYISKMYHEIYGEYITTNEVLKAYINDEDVHRSYFNKEKIATEIPYIYINPTSEFMSYEEALNKDLVIIYDITKQYTKEEVEGKEDEFITYKKGYTPNDGLKKVFVNGTYRVQGNYNGYELDISWEDFMLDLPKYGHEEIVYIKKNPVEAIELGKNYMIMLTPKAIEEGYISAQNNGRGLIMPRNQRKIEIPPFEDIDLDLVSDLVR